MPRNRVSYKPVRYYPRKKVNTSSTLKAQQRTMGSNLQNNEYNNEQTRSQAFHTSDRVHQYPINNILVFPQNSDACINVISPNNKDFSYKRYFKGKSKGKHNTVHRKASDDTQDVKPNINDIKFRNIRTSNVNRHTIILSDSEDDISFDSPINTKGNTGNSANVLSEKKSDTDGNNDRNPICIDDDVIIIENEVVNDVIEIDDGNAEQMNSEANHTTDECNVLLSTPESSASNDFLENSQLNHSSKFNFSLHGSEFKDSEFLRPTVNVDVSECGSISSVSDISSSLKTNVFNLVDFPKEKENLFDENNLEKFKNAITPQRQKTVIENHNNLTQTGNMYGKNQLPTLSEIGSDENAHKRVRGHSVIRELVNDRAYVLLSSAEKKMKSKKRKSKDNISNSVNETELTENTSPGTSKKKKRKKLKKKEVNLLEVNDSYSEFTDNNFSTSSLQFNTSKNKKHDSLGNNSAHETCEDNTNIEHSNKIMIRSDLFSDIDVNLQDKNKSESSNNVEEEILEKSEITSKHKQKKFASAYEIETNDSRRKSKKDKSVSGYSENYNSSEHVILKKSDKNIQLEHVEQIECNEDVNTILVDKKRKRKREQKLSEQQIVDADSEISTDVSIISKRKPKKKRLSENQETENYKPPNDNHVEFDSNKSGKIIGENISLNSEGQSHLYIEGENLPISENLNKSSSKAHTDNKQKVDETEINRKCKQIGENDKAKVSMLDITSDVPEMSSSMHTSKNVYSEHLQSVDNNCTDSKESIRTMLTDVGPSTQIIEGVHSTKSSFSEENCKSSLIDVNQDQKNFYIAATAGSVSSASESLAMDNKTSNKATEKNEVVPSIEDSSLQPCHSLISPSFTCKQENSEQISILTEVKIEDSVNDSPQVTNPSGVCPLNEASKKNELYQIGNDHEKVIEHVVEIKTQNLEKTVSKEQELNLDAATESKLPFVSVEQECVTDVCGVEGKLPDVIKKIISKKDPVNSMRKLCEFLEEVNDPQDVLKKVSMIKEAFLAKSVDAEVNSPSVVEEHKSDDDDIVSILADDSSIVCIESDSSDFEIIDDITLINCESSTSTEEEEKDKDGLETGKSVSDKDLTNDEDVCNDTKTQETSVPFQHSITESYKRRLDKYDVEDIQKCMSDDQKLWEISSKDLPQNHFVPKGKRCIKCREIGHLGNNCPNKKNLPRCILCGIEGHLDFKCPNRICTQCGRNSSIMKSSCQQCKHYRSLTCSLCKMRGHPRHKCPDLWRRYHLTVDHGPIVKPEGTDKLKNKENLWCSFCAKSGHLEHYCYLARKYTNFPQLDPSIRHYIDIYCQEASNEIEVRNKNKYISKNAAPLEKPVVFDTNEVVSKNTVPGHSLELLQGDVSASSQPSLEEPKIATTSVELTTQDATLRNSPRASVDVGIEGLPSDYVINELVDKLEVELPVSKQNMLLEGTNSTTTNAVEHKGHSITNKSRDVTHSKELPTNNNNLINSESCSSDVHSNKDLTSNLESLPAAHVENTMGNADSNFDSLNYFLTSDIMNLKNFLISELNLLWRSFFKVKNYYYRLVAYKEDSKKPYEEWKIPLLKKQKLYKEINMMLFGRKKLKEGEVHCRNLEKFAFTASGYLTRRFRELLCHSYEYIFSNRLHEHINYEFMIEMLMKEYPNKTI